MKVFGRIVLSVVLVVCVLITALPVTAVPVLAGDMGKGGYLTTFSLGYHHSAAITLDGSLYTWGTSYDGRLGHEDGKSKNIPTKVENIPQVVAVSLGYDHSGAITSDGSLYTWGNGYYGRLGHGDTIERSVPTKVKNIPKVVAINFGYEHSAAITEDGSLYTWGRGNYGILGHGDTEDKLIPTKVKNIPKIIAVSLGARHSAAITEDGSLYTWGGGTALGHGDTTNKYIPTKVENIPKVIAVSLGDGYSAAITEDGSLYTWGSGNWGTLGHGDSAHVYVPKKVEGISKVIAIGMGAEHSAAITEDGSLYTWGRGEYGKLGYGDSTNRNIPTRVENIPQVIAVNLGFYHNSVITADGSLYTWGGTGDRLGLGNTTLSSISTPTLVTALPGKVKLPTGTGIGIDTDQLTKITFEYGVDKPIDAYWGGALFSGDSRTIDTVNFDYHKNLAIISAVLSICSYDMSENGNLYQALNKLGVDTTKDFPLKSDSTLKNPAYSISHRKINVNGNEQSIVFVTIRGTVNRYDLLTDITGTTFSGSGYPREHDGFSAAKDQIISRLTKYLIDEGISAGDSKILITGHSYGGAVANLVAKSLEDTFAKSNIYCYTFAAPNNIVTLGESGLFGLGMPTYVYGMLNYGNSDYNIHNFRNVLDLIPYLPVAANPEVYTLYGKRHLFSFGRIGLLRKNHDMTHYLNHTVGLTNKSIDALPFRTIIIGCPIDVTAYDIDGNIIGAISNNVVDETITEILMFSIGDEKHIIIPRDESISLKLTSTDAGIMSFDVYDYDLVTGDIYALEEFNNISLTAGKLFAIDIDDERTAEDIQVYVVENSGEVISTVNTDGSEAPTFNADIGSIKVDGVTFDPSKTEFKHGVTYTVTFTTTEGNVVTHWTAKYTANRNNKGKIVPLNATVVKKVTSP